MKRTNKMLTECPNCGSIWGPGSEEWDWQQCDCCGWPDNDDDYEEDDYDEDDIDSFYEDNNPNDSRNL